MLRASRDQLKESGPWGGPLEITGSPAIIPSVLVTFVGYVTRSLEPEVACVCATALFSLTRPSGLHAASSAALRSGGGLRGEGNLLADRGNRALCRMPQA